MTFGIPSGATKGRGGPRRFNKTLRRQILKRKQRIGKITAGATPQTPQDETDPISALLKQKNVTENSINRAIAASLLGQGSTPQTLITTANEQLKKFGNKFTAQSTFLQEFLNNLRQGG